MNRNNRKPKTIRKQKLWKIKKTSPRKFPSTLNDIKENFAQCSLNTHTLITHNKVRPPCESNDKNLKKRKKIVMFFVKSIEPSFERKQKFVFFYCSQCKCPHFPYPIHTSSNKFTIYQLRNGTLVLYSTVILLHTDALFSPNAPAGKKYMSSVISWPVFIWTIK